MTAEQTQVGRTSSHTLHISPILSCTGLKLLADATSLEPHKRSPIWEKGHTQLIKGAGWQVGPSQEQGLQVMQKYQAIQMKMCKQRLCASCDC